MKDFLKESQRIGKHLRKFVVPKRTDPSISDIQAYQIQKQNERFKRAK